jgi:hypothetical protein
MAERFKAGDLRSLPFNMGVGSNPTGDKKQKL